MKPENIIRFSQHAFDRYSERMKKIYGSRIKEYGRVDEGKLRNEILMNGDFYIDVKSGNPNEFYCIVNKLTVYMGCINEDGSLYITTTYPYSKNFQGKATKFEKRVFPVVQTYRDENSLEARLRKFDK
jgi:hypothetical protein